MISQLHEKVKFKKQDYIIYHDLFFVPDNCSISFYSIKGKEWEEKKKGIQLSIKILWTSVLPFKENSLRQKRYLPPGLMIDQSSIGKKTDDLIINSIVWIKPVIIKRKYGIACPDIVSNHPGKKEEEGYK